MLNTAKCVVALFVLLLILPVQAADLQRAKTLQANGFVDDAKKELLDLALSESTDPEIKAEALLILGEIAENQKNFDGARQNWLLVLEQYPSSKAAAVAKSKLAAPIPAATVTEAVAESEEQKYKATDVLVVPDRDYPWAAPQIAAVLGSPTQIFDGSLIDATNIAKKQNLAGVLEIKLDTKSVYESGYVVCYHPNGKEAWAEKVIFNLGGGHETIARRYTKKLAEKIKGRKCP